MQGEQNIKKKLYHVWPELHFIIPKLQWLEALSLLDYRNLIF